MKRTTKPTFARRIDNLEHQPYSRHEVNTSIKGMTRELRTCPEEKINKLIHILTEMKSL